jgi:hypothetical protein
MVQELWYATVLPVQPSVAIGKLASDEPDTETAVT